MVINGHPEPARPTNSVDHDPAARRDRCDSPGHDDDTPRTPGDLTVGHGGAARVAAGHLRHPLPSAAESNYPAPASAESVPTSRLRVELPQDGPALTPGAARALLRVILTAAADPQRTAIEPPQPPRETP
jgi:hypothetical protein